MLQGNLCFATSQSGLGPELTPINTRKLYSTRNMCAEACQHLQPHRARMQRPLTHRRQSDPWWFLVSASKHDATEVHGHAQVKRVRRVRRVPRVRRARRVKRVRPVQLVRRVRRAGRVKRVRRELPGQQGILGSLDRAEPPAIKACSSSGHPAVSLLRRALMGLRCGD